MEESVLVDTWGWVALGYRRDAHHTEARAFYDERRAAGARIYTTDFILDEVITLLFRRAVFAEASRFMKGIFSAAAEGHLLVQEITPMLFERAWAFRRRYKNKPEISFTDLTSFAVMNALGIRQVMTQDDHFIRIGMGYERLP
jgi:uncharacterized protein